MVMISLVLDVKYTFALFLINWVLFIVYDYKATEKFSWIYFIFLALLMIAEIGFLYDYEAYIIPITFAYLGGQLCFLWLLKPMLNLKISNFSTHNLLELIIGFIGISFIVLYVLYLLFPLIPNVALFLPSTIAFICTVLLTFGIPFFNKHPDNIILWGIGGGIIGEMLFGFVYQYISDYKLFIALAFVFGTFFRVLFATYLVRIKDIKATESEYNQIL